jgi:hypothetical protein
VDDAELLQGLAGVCQRLLEAAHKQVGEQFGTNSDDARWPYPFPLKSDLQIKHLFVQTEDAFNVAWPNLAVRTSAAGIGAIRFLAEGFVLIRWLTEPSDETEQRKRAYRFVLGEISDTRRMFKHTADSDSSTVRSLEESAEMLRGFAREDGIQYLDEPPRADSLFKTYLEPGYILFSTLSEIGSHPGLAQMLVFHQDPGTRMINVDLTGQPVERAFWSSAAFDFFARTCDEIGKFFGWDDWLRGTVMPIVLDAAPLMTDAKVRWEKKWGIETGDVPG